ncbi:uncharacterized protein LOC144345857 [Saccoglossus kowalevskii]
MNTRHEKHANDYDIATTTQHKLRCSERQYNRQCRYHNVNYIRTKTILVMEYQLSTMDLDFRQKIMKKRLERLKMRKGDIERQKRQTNTPQLPTIARARSSVSARLHESVAKFGLHSVDGSSSTQILPKSTQEDDSDLDTPTVVKIKSVLAKWKTYKREEDVESCEGLALSDIVYHRDYSEITKIAPLPMYAKENHLASIKQGGIHQWLGIDEKRKLKRAPSRKSQINSNIVLPVNRVKNTASSLEDKKQISFAALVQAVMAMKVSGVNVH